MLLSPPLLGRPFNTIIQIAELEQSPHRALRTDALFLLRVLRMLPTRTEEFAVKVVVVVGGAPAAVALAHPYVVFGIRDLHFPDTPPS